MNRLTLMDVIAPHPSLGELQAFEREARRLRSQYAGDRLASLAIAIELGVRRLAHRIAGRTPCHS